MVPGETSGADMWWLALLIACSDDERFDALEARVVELETKQATLEAELAEKRAAAEAPPTPAVDLSHWPVREIEPGRYTIDYERMKPLLAGEEWSKQARAIAHRGPDGEIDGFRISGIRRTSVVAALGLKNGDILHSLNGIPLVDMEHAMSASELLDDGVRLEASITHRGVPTTLVWEPGTIPVEADSPAD